MRGVRRAQAQDHHTLWRDGSPRMSGIEVDISGGEVWLGSMPGAMKARDLLRDGRVALHSAAVDPEMTTGDAKLAGRALEVTDEAVKAGRPTNEQPPGPTTSSG